MTQRGVDLDQLLAHLRRVGSGMMRGMIDLIEVQGDEIRSFAARQVQPGST